MVPSTAKDFYSDVVQRMMDGAAELNACIRDVLPADYRPDKTLEQSILELDGHNGRDGCICDIHADVCLVNPACPVKGLRVHNCTGQCLCRAVGDDVEINPACGIKGLQVLGGWDLKTPEDTDHFETWEQMIQHSKIFVQVRIACSHVLNDNFITHCRTNSQSTYHQITECRYMGLHIAIAPSCHDTECISCNVRIHD
jgi:hypothetical protein